MSFNPPQIKSYSPSIVSSNGSIKSNNSTCPLPTSVKQQQQQQQQQQQHQQQHQHQKRYQLSRDVTALYELFSATTTRATIANNTTVCYCCEREVTKKRIWQEQEEECNSNNNKRKIINNTTTTKLTSALYYGSNQVRKYMKKVMTRDTWNDILAQGFPCPHIVLWTNNNEKRTSHYFCTLCDTNQNQHTLRLTLTPSSCRASDNEIYGHLKHQQQQPAKKRKER